MAEDRKYRVLALITGVGQPEDDALAIAVQGQGRVFSDLGAWQGTTPEQAIEAAVNAKGLPNEHRGRCIAVPESKWHERDVARRMEPVFEVGQVEEGAA